MRVLVACEFSGVVRETFLERGHDAYSCDLEHSCYLPDRSRRHIRGDVRPLLREKWDLVIAHPPCTYLTNTGVCWLSKDGVINEERWGKMLRGVEFFNECLNANADRVCVENPIMHKYARDRITQPYSQIIHPWQFGHRESKATCLWLRGLPPLRARITKKPEGTVTVKYSNRDMNLKGPWRGRMRSITPQGIADAMVEDWG